MSVRRASLFVLLLATAFAQQEPDSEPHWLKIDQLCGQLQFAVPENGPVRIGAPSRFRAPFLTNASLSLYAARPREKRCCGAKPIATVQSNEYGGFHFQGLRSGNYWLRVQKDGREYIVPLRITSDFNQRTCFDTSIARDIVVNSKPPSIQVRIR
jgi:hypothetical protein